MNVTNSKQSKVDLLTQEKAFPLRSLFALVIFLAAVMEEEVWKDIPGFEGYYQVSNVGRVKSLARAVPNSAMSCRDLRETVLQPGKEPIGYLRVHLRSQNKRLGTRIHKLMQKAFMDDKTSYIDHINGDKSDNRLENLRVCTQQQNNFNRKKSGGTSKYKGVSKVKSGKWVVYIKKNRKNNNLGCFECEIEAAKVYDEAAKKKFGEFACLNFPEVV